MTLLSLISNYLPLPAKISLLVWTEKNQKIWTRDSLCDLFFAGYQLINFLMTSCKEGKAKWEKKIILFKSRQPPVYSHSGVFYSQFLRCFTHMGSSSVFSLLRPTKVEARRSFLRICLYNMCISLVFLLTNWLLNPEPCYLFITKGERSQKIAQICMTSFMNDP